MKYKDVASILTPILSMVVAILLLQKTTPITIEKSITKYDTTYIEVPPVVVQAKPKVKWRTKTVYIETPQGDTIKVQADSSFCPPFIATFDTIGVGNIDTLKIDYLWPVNIFNVKASIRPEKLMQKTVEITVTPPRPDKTDTMFGLAGIVVGFLIGKL